LDNPWVIDDWHLMLRLLLSVLLGGLIGYERERKNHAAGLKTHTLVSLGSCLIMVLSIYGFSEFVGQYGVNRDPARLAAQAITGIGFLGAGTILFTGKSIKGLTTAASLWVVMAIGLAVGAGFYVGASFTVFLALAVLWGLNVIEKRYVNHPREFVFSVTALADRELTEPIRMLLETKGAKLIKVQFDENAIESAGPGGIKIRLTIRLAEPLQAVSLAEQLRKLEGIRSVSAE